jgi:hypothetical protein
VIAIIDLLLTFLADLVRHPPQSPEDERIALLRAQRLISDEIARRELGTAKMDPPA